MSAVVHKGIHDILVKLIAAAVGVYGLTVFFGALGDDGFFGVVTGLVWGLVLLATAAGFFRYRGWAFLFVSVLLLYGFFHWSIRLLLAWDGQGSLRTAALMLLLDLVLIGYLGRWGMERRFRPHLDVEHH